MADSDRTRTPVRDVTRFRKGRKERATFVCEEFPFVHQAESILDVGCDENYVKELLGEKVTGIDLAGNPDRVVDLESEGLKQFDDNSFDVIISTEVLEHLFNFHDVLDDMVRVARERVVISLPNCTSTERLITMMRRHRSGKHYGLPLEPQQDRHKWFFSYREIIEFFEKYAEKNGIVVKEVVLHHNLTLRRRTSIPYFFRRLLLSVLRNVFRSQNTCESAYVVLDVRS